MPKIKKTKQELEIELHEQLLAFRSSIESYDKGVEWEAKRIASSIYILCFDGSGRTRSLLGLLGIKNKIKYLSTYNLPKVEGIDIYVHLTVPNTPLLKLYGDDKGVSFPAAFDVNKPAEGWDYLSFGKWWDQCLFYPNTGISLSRKNLVFIVRSQDGGSHVDGHLSNLDYRTIRTVGQPNVWVGIGDQEGSPPGNTVWAIMRQIAWELDESFKLASI